MYRTRLRCGGELGLVSRMGSASLRNVCLQLLEGNLPKGERQAFAAAIGNRALEIRADMRHWDLVVVLQVMKQQEDQAITESLWAVMKGKLSHLSPKHLIDLYVAGNTDLREVEYRLIELANSSMYIDEYVAVFRTIAKSEKSVFLINGLCEALICNESLQHQIRYLHACEIVGALIELDFLPEKIHKICLLKCQTELEVMPLEEVWKTITGFSKLCYSSEKLELMCKLCLQQKNVSFDQVSRPIDFLQFCRLNGWLTEPLLLAACVWANNAVYRPATRTQAHRRPTIFEVAFLADMCNELNVGSDKIEKAIRVTVESKGGTRISLAKPKPTKYRRRRAYLKQPDGYVERGESPIVCTNIFREVKKESNQAAFAPTLRASATKKGKHVPLWQSRSNGWFFRK